MSTVYMQTPSWSLCGIKDSSDLQSRWRDTQDLEPDQPGFPCALCQSLATILSEPQVLICDKAEKYYLPGGIALRSNEPGL